MLKTLIDFDNSVLDVDNTLYNSTARFPAPGLESSFVNSMLTESFGAKKIGYGLTKYADLESHFYTHVFKLPMKTALTLQYVN